MEKQFECIKIKDGLYLGNKLVAFDLQFLIINKFAFIVNCASQVPNLYEEHGLKYLKFKIKNQRNMHIFDQQLKRLKKLKKVVQDAEQSGLCCLVHCNHDGQRSLTLIIAYLMDRFRWRLRKTIDFLQSKGVSIILTDNNIQQLTALEYTLSRQVKLSHLWIGPFIDDQEQVLTKTFNNTSKPNNIKQGKPNSPIKNQLKKQQEFDGVKKKRVQWLDKIQKQEKKEKKRLLAEKKEEKKEHEKSREKLEDQTTAVSNMRGSNTNKLLAKGQNSKKSKKKIDAEHPQAKKKIQQTQILKLLKKSGKLKKDLIDEQHKLEQKEKQQSKEYQKVSKADQKEELDKKVYKLTINNYINPNFNIIKPTDKKKKTKTTQKKEKDKFNRTYSQKEAFKKPTFYAKQMVIRDKDGSREKRNAGNTPIRTRKERKSQKDNLV